MAGPPAARDASAISSAAITPSAPSSQPPVGCVSECDPSKRDGTGAKPKRLPIASKCTANPASAIRPASQLRAATSGAEQSGRITPMPFAPKLRR
jgi:hypothetical protein